jgi:hypothetical protein
MAGCPLTVAGRGVFWGSLGPVVDPGTSSARGPCTPKAHTGPHGAPQRPGRASSKRGPMGVFARRLCERMRRAPLPRFQNPPRDRKREAPASGASCTRAAMTSLPDLSTPGADGRSTDFARRSAHRGVDAQPSAHDAQPQRVWLGLVGAVLWVARAPRTPPPRSPRGHHRTGGCTSASVRRPSHRKARPLNPQRLRASALAGRGEAWPWLDSKTNRHTDACCRFLVRLRERGLQALE